MICEIRAMRDRREYALDGKEVVWFSLQKTVEATMSEKVVEWDKQQAIENVLHNLKEFASSWGIS